MLSLQDYLADHLSIEDEREKVSSVPSSLSQSATKDDSCAGHKVQNAFGSGGVMFGVTFNPAGQPKMICPSTIISPPNKDQSGGNTMSSSSILPPPSTSSQRTTHSPSHRIFPFQAITSKPTKITSQCAPAKELADLCVSAPNRICIDNQQDKVTWQLMLWTWGLACNSRAFS